MVLFMTVDSVIIYLCVSVTLDVYENTTLTEELYLLRFIWCGIK